MLTLGTGCGGGAVLDGQLYRGWAEFGHMVIVYDGLPCQGTCTGRGHLEPYVTGVAAAKLAQEEFGPGGRRAPARTARERGRAAGDRDPRRHRPAPRRRHRHAREHLQSGARRDRRRLRRSAATSCSTRRARSLRARRSRGAGKRIRDRAGRARDRRRPDRRRPRRLRRARLDAARRLRDADREPRRRDAARARRSCASADVGAVRGHAAHARVARPPRHLGARCSRTTSTTRRSGRRSCCRAWRRASAWRSSATPACRGSAIPVPGSSAAALWTPACPSRSSRARRPSRRRSSLVRLRRRAVPVRRLSAAGSARRCASLWEELVALASSRRGVRVASAAAGDAAFAGGGGAGA